MTKPRRTKFVFMKKLSFLLTIFALAFVLSSCSKDEQFAKPEQKIPLKFEVGAYPIYNDVTRATVGTPDAGKVEWSNGDVVLVKITNNETIETLTLTYDNGNWNPNKEITDKGSSTIEVLYAPGCEWGNNHELKLISQDAPYGTFEYVTGDSELDSNIVYVNFYGKRTYSRLRLTPRMIDTEINVITTGFTPAGPTSISTPSEGYNLITDSKGNAYLYGIFSSNATIKVKKEDIVLKEYKFSESTTSNKSYALDAIPYVTFSAEDTQTFYISKKIESLEYSVNGSEWEELESKSISFGGDLGDLRLRGKSSIGTASSANSYATISFGISPSPVLCSGDIRTLVDYENFLSANTTEANFHRLFYRNSKLVTAPSLPATTLADECYYEMFSECTALTQAPELPATTLASSCYSKMFYGCTSLTTAPELPATTLADFCYYYMFSGCTALSQAPEILPATKLKESCYRYMFSDCSNLTQAPELPATTLASGCYQGMFSGCSSLTSAPQLPATTLAPYCYENMFSGCTALTSTPRLPATTLVQNCYNSMFRSCTKLNRVTMVATNITSNYSLENWLVGVAPEGTFIKAPTMTSLPIGYSGIPEGWIVLDDTTYAGGWIEEEELN